MSNSKNAKTNWRLIDNKIADKIKKILKNFRKK